MLVPAWSSTPLIVTEDPSGAIGAEEPIVKPGTCAWSTVIDTGSDTPRRLRASLRNTTRTSRSPGRRQRNGIE